MDFLNVDEVIGELDIKDSMMIAEFGCGSANFAVALARKLKEGWVYALDIQEEKLSALKGRLSVQKIRNIRIILCDLEKEKGSTLAQGYLDIVVIPNLLFQVQDKHAIINEAKRTLKQGGQLLVVDWLKKNPLNQIGDILDPNQVKTMAQSLGFTLKKEFAAGDYHYGLLFIKK